MGIAIITGAAGLVGVEACKIFSGRFDQIIGIDADFRSYFFGRSYSISANADWLLHNLPDYEHKNTDIRDQQAISDLFESYGSAIKLIINAAAQPSHDWASKEPATDYSINASGPFQLLELMRNYCPDAVFIQVSTNKVYGDHPNRLPLRRYPERYDLAPEHPYYSGISETMPVDQCLHSPFGASKLAADIVTQEYGLYFGLKTSVFRAGCISGGAHLGAEEHGFLSYLVTCAQKERTYTVYGFEGKQVRDNIHARDLVAAFLAFYRDPSPGSVYNIGGGRENGCSVLEAVKLVENRTNKSLAYQYKPEKRVGDHQWWITDYTKFQKAYPEWQIQYNLTATIDEILNQLKA